MKPSVDLGIVAPRESEYALHWAFERMRIFALAGRAIPAEGLVYGATDLYDPSTLHYARVIVSKLRRRGNTIVAVDGCASSRFARRRYLLILDPA